MCQEQIITMSWPEVMKLQPFLTVENRESIDLKQNAVGWFLSTCYELRQQLSNEQCFSKQSFNQTMLITYLLLLQA